ncbi:unnamed protein product [Parnassius mnemosyne]|uniref:CCHC-type domain-containing protein n=1 Tax=Parnassius mnemosyne TaxID=213953 RepID=A0AAV1M618_9NEOP
MIMAIEHSGIAINSDVIKTKLLDMSSEVGNHDSEVALLSKHKSKFGQNLNTKGEKQTSNYTSNVKKVIKCYKCRKIGHFKNQCPKVKEKQVNAFSAAFFNSEFNKDDWYIDSGASIV